ncbi:hypothetical protein, partial [Providencia stuartii]|uniref:hypothetical protein n=1 Tax=Providencia stuartii TaxID=588 RepID=UPI001EF99A49
GFTLPSHLLELANPLEGGPAHLAVEAVEGVGHGGEHFNLPEPAGEGVVGVIHFHPLHSHGSRLKRCYSTDI